MAEIQVFSSIEVIVCNSLKLLGLSNSEINKEGKLQLSEEMFKKSNTKALECILYFIFSKISPSSLGNFVFCWPPRTAEMKREFKEESYKLIQKLENDSRIPDNSLLGKSVLDSAQGERVWTLLKVLTDACLKLEVSVPHFPNLAGYIQNPLSATRSSVYRMKKAYIIHISNYAQDFNQKVLQLKGLQENWISHSKDLSRQHNELREELDRLVNLKRKVDQNTLMQEKLAALDRVPQIDMLKYLWKGIEGLMNVHLKSRSVEQVVHGEGCKMLVTGIVEKGIQDWSEKLKSARERAGFDRNGLTVFIKDLQVIVSKFKSRQELELEKLRSSKIYFEDILNKNN